MARCRSCLTVNSGRRKYCEACGKTLPKKRRPAHMKALELPYEHYLAVNGGQERCGICGKRPTAARRLDRDHDHKSGAARGLLCPGNQGCNRRLGRVDDIQWLEAAAAYLRRAA